MKSPLRFSTWVIPLSYAVVAVAAGMVFPRLETPIFHGLRSTVTVSDKALKGNLRLKTFVGTSENALQTQIWTALIAM